MAKSKPEPKPAKPTGYIVINLTRGAIDGIYMDNRDLVSGAFAHWREQFPGDLIVAAKLLDWSELPSRFFARGEVRWMNDIEPRDRPGLQHQPGA